jgi:SNF2 family DNA or RNA helicase
MAMLYDKGKINGALIIAPKGVIETWYSQELPAHLPDHVEKVSVLWQSNINKKQQKNLDKLFESGHDLHILIMNVEAFSTSKGKQFATKFLLSHKTLMVVDESTTVKNPKAKRTRNIIDLSTDAVYRRILTGSPVTKNPLDLFTQCYFLDPYHLDHQSYYSFRTRYAIMKTAHSIQLVAGFKHLDELAEKLKPFSYRVLKEDCLDLPDKIYMKRIIELTPEQKQVYKQMRREALAIFNGKTVTTMIALTQLMRLHQITCGHFVADDGTIQELKSNRLNELLDVLDEVEGKSIIWAHYQYDIKHIVAALKKKYGPCSVVDYYGATPQDQRQKNRDNFQNNPEVRYLVGTPATGGYGITLTAANTVIYYSNGYDLEKRIQSEDRAHRIGQHKPVTYVDIIAEETVDEKIVKALRKKINIASQVMDEELRSWI